MTKKDYFTLSAAVWVLIAYAADGWLTIAALVVAGIFLGVLIASYWFEWQLERHERRMDEEGWR